jgi:predicted DNA-binding transcriptional regulator AlpA
VTEEVDKTNLRTVPEVAGMFNVAASTIYRHTNSGEIEHTTLHGRTVLTIQAAEDWIRDNMPSHLNPTAPTAPTVTGSPTTDSSDMAITLREAASLVHIKLRTIYQAIYDKDIIPVSTKIPAKVNRNDIIAWAASYTGPIRHSVGPNDHTLRRSHAVSSEHAAAPAPAPALKNQSIVTSENAGDMVASTIDKLVAEVIKLRHDNASLREGNIKLAMSLHHADEALARRE